VKTNKPALALALGLALCVSSAEAGITTLTVTPGAGSTMLEGQDGSSRLFPMVGVTDPNNSANYASVTAWGSAGSYGLGVNANVLAMPSISGTVTAASNGAITAPSVTVSLSSSTTAYATGQLLCSSATYTTCNTSMSGQTFAIANSAGGASIPRLRVYSNDTSSTAWANAQVQVDLWTAAPTLGSSGGDRAAFLADMATGSAGHLASYSCTFSAFAGDGVYSECAPLIGNAPATKLASGTSIYVTVIDLTASGTVTASKSITVVPEVWN
jgi:hypothetical protein